MVFWRYRRSTAGRGRASSAFAIKISLSLLAILLLVQSKIHGKSRLHQASRPSPSMGKVSFRSESLYMSPVRLFNIRNGNFDFSC
jgi:hypothetical protein